MRSNDVNNHFRRMDGPVNIDEEGGTETEYCMMLSGDCAWSLDTCCRTSGYSDGIDLFAENTRELNITMEAYSQEPGIGFQEHYIYRSGECIADECVDWTEWYWDRSEYPDFEKFKPANKKSREKLEKRKKIYAKKSTPKRPPQKRRSKKRENYGLICLSQGC